MKNIAITGGIGAGKSTVTSYLVKHGYTVVDADKMARSLTEPGGLAIPFIKKYFGPDFIAEDGGMDREKMRKLVFSNKEAKELLEKGTTQLVLEDIKKIKIQAASKNLDLLFFDIPLLFEQGMEHEFDLVMVISATHDKRVERVMARDQMGVKMINDIMDSQVDDEYKIQHADIVLYNNGTIEQLNNNLEALLVELKKII